MDNHTLFENYRKDPDIQRLITKVLSKFRRLIPYDELVNCGMIGLWNAILIHRDGLGNKFTTSLYNFVRWECLAVIHWNMKLKNSYQSSNDVGEKNKFLYKFNELIDGIEQEYRTILIKYYVYRYTLKEIGEQMNCGYESVRKKLLKAYKMIREKYNDI